VREIYGQRLATLEAERTDRFWPLEEQAVA
jgi:hypothetical protein